MSVTLRPSLSHSQEDSRDQPVIPIIFLKLTARLDRDWASFTFKTNEVSKARFDLIGRAFNFLSLHPQYSREICRQFTILNRYPDVFPYDNHRCTLRDGNYINVSPVYLREKCYFVGQAPLQTTLNHFFTFLLEQNIKTIVTLAMPFENNRIKCTNYWMPGRTHTMPDGTQVRTLFEKVIAQSRTTSEGIVKRVIQIGNTLVTQYHYVDWPDMGICSKQLLRRLLEEVDDDRPFVHCSAGLGRSGVFALAHFGLAHPQEFHLEKALILARMQRFGLVQTFEQYELIHSLVH